MTREEKVTKRVERLHAIEDAIITLLYYGMTWTVFMVIISKMLRLF